MIPGFHCSSLEMHDPVALMPVLRSIGFRAVAIRPVRGRWDPDSPWFETVTEQLAAAARENAMTIVVDLDAFFFDDLNQKDPFSLVSDDGDIRKKAIQKIERWIEAAARMAPVVLTFSSGRVNSTRAGRSKDALEFGAMPSVSPEASASEEALERLSESLAPLLVAAENASESAGDRHGAKIKLALRPVSEHLIATVAQFERFAQWLPQENSLGLAADVGEMLLGGEFPIGARLARLQHRLSCVYLCEPDLERGCDQRPGQGDIDLGRVWEVMTQSGYLGPAIFRGCGHSHLGIQMARDAWGILSASP